MTTRALFEIKKVLRLFRGSIEDPVEAVGKEAATRQRMLGGIERIHSMCG